MDFTQVGVVVKPHGLKGAVVFKMEPAYAAQLKDFSLIYLKQGGTFVPYALSEVANLQADMFKIVLRGVDDVQVAESFRGFGVYQTNDLILTEEELDLEGYTVFYGAELALGEVIQVIENKAQLLLVVEDGSGKEYMIPLVEDFIVESDPRSKKLVLDLPEGLLDL